MPAPEDEIERLQGAGVNAGVKPCATVNHPHGEVRRGDASSQAVDNLDRHRTITQKTEVLSEFEFPKTQAIITKQRMGRLRESCSKKQLNIMPPALDLVSLSPPLRAIALRPLRSSLCHNSVYRCS